MQSLEWKKFDWVPLQFDDFETTEKEGTRFYHIDEETTLPSMTTILSVLDDGGIKKWKDRVGDEEADKIVKEAVARGNSLHVLSERYLMNKLERKDVKGPGKILFNRNRPILNTLGPIVGIETCLYSRSRGFAGRTDCIAFQGKDLCIVDHKNTRRTIDLKKDYNRKKLFSYMIQCSGYAVAFHEMYPDLPMPSHGLLIVGDHSKMASSQFKFPIKPLISELDIVVDAYYNKRDIKDSAFFKL